MTLFRALSLVSALALCACAAKDENESGEGREPGDSGASADDDAATDASGSAPDDDAGSQGGSADGGGGGQRDGGDQGDGSSADGGADSAEVCDGKDNDGNGVVDDVDAEKDGVCDCLNIATIGDIGPWSNGGNVFKTWLNARSATPAVELGDQVLSDELLRKFQVIVVLYVGEQAVTGNDNRSARAHRPFTADEVAALGRWVRAGGGLMTTTGYSDENSEVTNMNLLLNPLGAGYSTSNKDTQGFVTQWESHPITANVMKIRTDNGVQPDGSAAMTLARDEGGRVALQVTQADSGRVAVWGDEWITYDSEWSDTQDQQVDRLWLNLLKWLSPAKVCQVDLPPVVLQ
ncbi:MAG TPA: hypothetical protein VFZ61_01200 [Polyangiales bacterium]